MGKKQQTSTSESKQHKHTKINRLANVQKDQLVITNRKTWPTNAVIYIGHLPHGFYENQLKQYFSQYGEVLSVKVARSMKTARSKGYAFIQFKYPEVAEIVAQTMNNYLLMGKVLVCNVLPSNGKNPFHYQSSKQFKFVNWKKIYIKKKNAPKGDEAITKEVQSLLKKQEERKQKFKDLGIKYQFPGFSALI